LYEHQIYLSTFIVVRYKKLTCINNRGQKGKFTVYEFTSCHIEFDRSLYYTNTIKIIPIRVNPSLPIAITISSQVKLTQEEEEEEEEECQQKLDHHH